MNKKNLHPIQVRVPEDLIDKIDELRQAGFNPAQIIRTATIEAVASKLALVKQGVREK